jgi:colanic acid biosynthesis glycosyl transferase WcaI
MKILIHDYAGHPFQVQLSRELAKRGIGVLHAYAGGLLTPRGALQIQASDPKSLRIHEVPMHPDYRRYKYSFIRRRQFEVAYGRELCNLIRRECPSVVLSGNTPTEPQWQALIASKQCGSRFAIWLQDFYSVAVDKLARKKLPMIGAIVGAYYTYLERKTFRKCSGVVSITEDFVPMLERWGVHAAKTVVIPNWAPLDELPVRPKENAWSARHSLNGCFSFLYSGTLAMKHNPELLLRLAIAFKQEPAVRVVVVSEGPGAEWLTVRKREHALDNLVLLPFQDFADMPDVLASSDVLMAVLEPDAGVFSVPSKALTYLCAGKPLLAGIPKQNLAARIIEGNQAGICLDPGDVDGFVKAGRELHGNAALRNEAGTRGRKYAEENFDISKIADQFERFLKELTR